MADFDPDSFADKLMARFKAAGRPLDDDHADLDGASDTARIPVSRLRAVTADNKRLREQLAELQGEVATARTAYQSRAEAAEKAAAKAAEKLREEAGAQVQTIAARHAEDLDLVELGFKDPLGRNAVRDAWGRVPEAQRGTSPVEWVRAQVEAVTAHRTYMADPKADPAKAPPMPTLPRTVIGYLPEPAKVEQPRTQTTTQRKVAAKVDENVARGGTGDFRDFDPTLGMDAFVASLRAGGDAES